MKTLKNIWVVSKWVFMGLGIFFIAVIIGTAISAFIYPI